MASRTTALADRPRSKHAFRKLALSSGETRTSSMAVFLDRGFSGLLILVIRTHHRSATDWVQGNRVHTRHLSCSYRPHRARCVRQGKTYRVHTREITPNLFEFHRFWRSLPCAALSHLDARFILDNCQFGHCDRAAGAGMKRHGRTRGRFGSNPGFRAFSLNGTLCCWSE